jgi:hypothetical protein
VGAFNLVRRAAYEKAGGHVPLRLDVLDDFKLGKLFMRCGLRQDMLLSDGLISVRWHAGLRGIIRGLEKNGFAAAGYSAARLLLATAAFVTAGLLPYAGLFRPHDARFTGYALAAAAMHAVFLYVCKRTGSGWHVSLSFPAALVLYLWAFWRSAAVTLMRGGVRWRDTFYPLRMLKENMYR